MVSVKTADGGLSLDAVRIKTVGKLGSIGQRAGVVDVPLAGVGVELAEGIGR
jgi:hypothetical protein